MKMISKKLIDTTMPKTQPNMRYDLLVTAFVQNEHNKLNLGS